MLAQQMVSNPVPLLADAPLAEFASYAIPGLIYFINNNCLFYILQEVDPTTFQLLSQMKTIFTGLLFRVFLKRHISPVQARQPHTRIGRGMRSHFGLHLRAPPSITPAPTCCQASPALPHRPALAAAHLPPAVSPSHPNRLLIRS
jgi:hypothetical protein